MGLFSRLFGSKQSSTRDKARDDVVALAPGRLPPPGWQALRCPSCQQLCGVAPRGARQIACPSCGAALTAAGGSPDI